MNQNLSKIKLIVIGLICFGLSSFETWAEDEKQGKDGFITIFDGKTLNGWEATPAKSAPAWEAKNGAIVGTGDKGRGYLTYSKNKYSTYFLIVCMPSTQSG